MGPPKGPKIEAECRERGEGQQAPSHQLWGLKEHCELRQPGLGQSPDSAKAFHYFQHSARIASPDTIILLIL